MTKNSVTLINAQAVDASGTHTSEVIPLEESLDKAIIYVINGGDSTEISVSVYGSPDEDGTIKTLIKKFDLTDSTTQLSENLTVVPLFLWVEATNTDATNATTYTIIMTKIA
jgi:hypothetical protein